ncbi:MGAT2 isoform 1 [Pongo abelii]|uniref:MGAT2 isoform 1 n=1 Tax=Pongo abelii TaxID=9601 RepID=A0A2J8WX39_PONAB|nr:MGAT2 isoform 1 [Pongo abelii]
MFSPFSICWYPSEFPHNNPRHCLRYLKKNAALKMGCLIPRIPTHLATSNDFGIVICILYAKGSKYFRGRLVFDFC